MGCYLSTSCFGNTFVSDAIIECQKLSPFGIEISAPHYFQNTDILVSILKKFNQAGVKLTLHNYFPPPRDHFVLNIASDDIDIQNQSKDLITKALNLCIASGSPIYGIHAGYLSDAKEKHNGGFDFDQNNFNYSKSLSFAVNFINEIVLEFEKNNKILLIENLFPVDGKFNSLFCSLAQIREFLSEIPKSVGLLLDLGHLNISSSYFNFDKFSFLDSFMNDFSDQLYEIHISENNGIEDQHLSLKDDSWQLEALKIINFQSYPGIDKIYCLESRNSSKEEIIKSLNLINEIIL